jgi:branched-chain amino acid transport system substrate-binding protein
MLKTTFAALASLTAALLASVGPASAQAQDTIKIGVVHSMTGGLANVGRQAISGARLYMQLKGDTVAGKKIVLILKDDTTVPDVARRLAQELIVNEKVNLLAVGITPVALAVAPLATEAKIPTVVLTSGTSVVVERSPYMVRTSFTLGQQASVMGDWAAKNGIKRVAIVQADWAPGNEATAVFTDVFTKGGGTVLETLKVPIASPDYSPFLQRAADTKPDAIFAYPSAQAGIFFKQFKERGLDKSGIKVIGPGDVTDDDDLPNMDDGMLGAITAGFYSASHDSPANKAYVEAFKKAFNFRPNFISVGGYDAMHLIYEALKKTEGKTDGDAVIAAMKGMKWESPRGPMSIDPETRDLIQNVYMRKIERVNGELYNTEFATVEAVKDPLHKK